MKSERTHRLPVIRPPTDWTRFGAGAFMTTRGGGVSQGPYGDVNNQPGLNLGVHVHDAAAAVKANQMRLSLELPAAPLWLNQVHGKQVFQAVGPPGDEIPTADAAVTNQSGVVLAILTADCLPVLLVDPIARVIGAVHGGWRGLVAGVLPETIRAMVELGANPDKVQAWLGAAIGPERFEVGPEVPAAFTQSDVSLQTCFRRYPGRPGKYLGDLQEIARHQLASVGVTAVSAADICTVQDERFYSFRRDGICGRMASLVWLI